MSGITENVNLKINMEGEAQFTAFEKKVRGLTYSILEDKQQLLEIDKRLAAQKRGLNKEELRQTQLIKRRMRESQINKQLNSLEVSEEVRITSQLNKQLRLEKQINAEKKRSSNASRQGGLIGAGFPLLFGGGAGSVIGGGIGGLAGEKFLGKGGGFAGSIALSAVGAQLDQIATDAKELATATGSLQGAYEYLGEKSLWLSEETKLQADAYIKAGDAAGLQRIANQQLALIQGVDGVDAAKKLYGANQELDLAMAILKQSFLNFATFLLNKIVPLINAIAGTAASNMVLGNAREMAKDDPALLKKIDEIDEKFTTDTPMLEGALKSALLNVLAGPLAPAANEILNPKGVKDLTKISEALSKEPGLNAPDTIQATLADRAWLDRSDKGGTGEAEKSNRDAENLLRAQQIYAIEQKRLTLMQTMEPMIGRAAAARDRAYALEKADFDTKVAKSKIQAQDIPPLEKKVKLDTEDLRLQQKILLLKRKDTERLMQEKKLLEETLQYSQLDYEIATATTKEKEKELKLKRKLLQIENSNKSDEQKKAEADAAKKMDGITNLDKYIAQLNKELNDTEGMIIQLSGTIINEFSSAMSSAITGLITGTKTAQEAFSEMFANIGKAFIDMATQMIAKALVMKALGILGGAFSGGGGGGLTADEGLGAGFSMGSGLAKKMADGGYVTGPTNAVVGEGGQPEYVIPASKMAAAMENYSAGARGDQVLGGNDSAGGGEGGSVVYSPSFETVSIGGESYVTTAQMNQAMEQGMAAAAKRGAAMGKTQIYSEFRNNRSTRQRLAL